MLIAGRIRKPVDRDTMNSGTVSSRVVNAQADALFSGWPKGLEGEGSRRAKAARRTHAGEPAPATTP